MSANRVSYNWTENRSALNNMLMLQNEIMKFSSIYDSKTFLKKQFTYNNTQPLHSCPKILPNIGDRPQWCSFMEITVQ